MKKYRTGIAILFSICILIGCGGQSPTVDFNDKNMTQMSESDMIISGENMTQVSETGAESTDENQTYASKRGSVVQETEDTVYFFIEDCIYAAEKSTNQIRILWKNEHYTPENYMLYGCGVIVSDKIYFLDYIEHFGDGMHYEEAVLSVINTDGSGYQQAVSDLGETLDYNGAYGFCGIYCSDGLLYAYNTKDVLCYRLLDDGNLAEEIPREETDFRCTQDLSEDYSLVCFNHSFHDYLSPVESMERYGSLIMQKGTSYVKIDVESGEEEWVNFGAPTFLEGDKVFYISYASDVQTLESFDFNTKEVETVCEIKSEGSVVRTAYADGIFYYMTDNRTSADNAKTTVSFYSVSDGTSGVLFEWNDKSEYISRFSPADFGLMIAGKNLYCMDMRNYDAYLVRVSLEDPSRQELLVEPVYRTRIGEVGTLASEHHDIYSETNSDSLLGTANFNWLVIDDSFAGAETINAYLYEAEVANALAIFENDVRMDEDIIDTYNLVYQQNPDNMYGISTETIDEYNFSYNYDSDISCIRYFDGAYVSFVQEIDRYYGGAHGTLFCNGYTFDLETGEWLLLTDIISNTEDELKEIVTKYFGEEIDENPEDFWADAKETVHETVSLETTDFVLTDDGICFYMYPYSVAAFVKGFPDVTIPYSEFHMKILE